MDTGKKAFLLILRPLFFSENWVEPRASVGELVTPRCYYAAVPMPELNAVYVMGGFDGTRYYEGSTRFDLDTMTWDDNSYTPLNERRCYINATRLADGQILACGGYNNAARLSSAEIFNVAQNSWIPIASMNNVRWVL
jgi:hypothetical protein